MSPRLLGAYAWRKHRRCAWRGRATEASIGQRTGRDDIDTSWMWEARVGLGSRTAERMAGTDANDVARLRVAIYREGLPAQLGSNAVAVYFAAAARDPDSFAFVVRDRRQVIGYILCTTQAIRIQRAMLRSGPRVWIRASLVGLRHPGTIRTAAGRLVRLLWPAPSKPGHDVEPRLRLLDIAVAPGARGTGVGHVLMESAIDEARLRGHHAIGLSVLEDNTPAVRLYERLGFTIGTRQVHSDGQVTQTMRLALRTADEST